MATTFIIWRSLYTSDAFAIWWISSTFARKSGKSISPKRKGVRLFSLYFHRLQFHSKCGKRFSSQVSFFPSSTQQKPDISAGVCRLSIRIVSVNLVSLKHKTVIGRTWVLFVSNYREIYSRNAFLSQTCRYLKQPQPEVMNKRVHVPFDRRLVCESWKWENGLRCVTNDVPKPNLQPKPFLPVSERSEVGKYCIRNLCVMKK